MPIYTSIIRQEMFHYRMIHRMLSRGRLWVAKGKWYA